MGSSGGRSEIEVKPLKGGLRLAWMCRNRFLSKLDRCASEKKKESDPCLFDDVETVRDGKTTKESTPCQCIRS